MRILVADDDSVIQTIVRAILQPEGHEIISAMNGTDALEAFLRLGPDLVLSDFSMPGMNGLELCKAIQRERQNRFVPVVMFTGAAYPNLLKESLEAGAIECLTTPFEPDELRVRIRALEQMLTFHHALAQEKANNDQELAIVKHVLERLLRPGHRAMPPSFHMETVQTQRISGDACVYGSGIPGVHFGLIVDATGHGLTAGVSTIPVVETFLGMVKKDIALDRIYNEINSKLCRMLPTGRFACLLLFRLDTNLGLLSVLNAGIPEALLQRDGQVIRYFASENLPAGIPELSQYEVHVEQADIREGDRFMAFSDGMIDAFGPEEIQRELLESPFKLSHNGHCSLIKNALAMRVQDTEQHDDISWALWEVPSFAIQMSAPHLHQSASTQLTQGLSISFTLNPRYFEAKDLLPQIQTLLSNQGVQEEHTQILMLLLTESIANAIEHGILDLESDIKSAQGFEAFDALRRLRLSHCQNAEVQLKITLLMQENTTEIESLQVEVTDSGEGFNWKSSLDVIEKAQHSDEVLPFGRGLTLIKALATDLTFNEKGNGIRFRLDCKA